MTTEAVAALDEADVVADATETLATEEFAAPAAVAVAAPTKTPLTPVASSDAPVPVAVEATTATRETGDWAEPEPDPVDPPTLTATTEAFAVAAALARDPTGETFGRATCPDPVADAKAPTGAALTTAELAVPLDVAVEAGAFVAPLG